MPLARISVDLRHIVVTAEAAGPLETHITSTNSRTPDTPRIPAAPSPARRERPLFFTILGLQFRILLFRSLANNYFIYPPVHSAVANSRIEKTLSLSSGSPAVARNSWVSKEDVGLLRAGHRLVGLCRYATGGRTYWIIFFNPS